MNTQEIYEHVLRCLEDGTPMSLVRWGEGETQLFGASGKRKLQKHLGYVVSDKQLADIRKEFTHTVAHCDILGWELTGSPTLDTDAWRYNLVVIPQQMPDYLSKIPCSMLIHWQLLSKGYLDKLLQGRDSIYYVAGRNVTAGLKHKYGIAAVQGFHVEPQRLFETGKQQHRHYPDQHDLAHDWIRSLGSLKGKLCLVGAGIVGKVYLHWFKQQGGVALDLGSVFDLWYGKRTRGKGRSPTATVDTYKLLK